MSHHIQKFKQAIIENTGGMDFETSISHWDLLYVVDRQDLISNCICDKAIRYEYHIGNRFIEDDPHLIVGSSCIFKVLDADCDLYSKVFDAEKIMKMGKRKVQFGAKLKGKTFNEIANDPSCSKWVMQNLTNSWSNTSKDRCRLNLREYIRLSSPRQKHVESL